MGIMQVFVEIWLNEVCDTSITDNDVINANVSLDNACVIIFLVL